VAGPVKKYGFIHAKLRARLSKLIPEETLKRMIDANDLQEALQYLKNTPYEAVINAYTDTGDIKMGELELMNQEISTIVEILKYIKDETYNFVEALAIHYEVEVIKDAFRFWFDREIRGRDVGDSVSYLYRGELINNINFDTIIYAESIEEIQTEFRNTIYAPVMEKKLPKVQSENSLFPLETALEALYYKNLIEKMTHLSKRDLEIAERVIGVRIDIENISRIVRFSRFTSMKPGALEQYLIGGGRFMREDSLKEAYESKNPEQYIVRILGSHYADLGALTGEGKKNDVSQLKLIAAFLDDVLDREIKKLLVGYPFTIGIILAYVMVKQREISNLIKILNGKYYKLESGRLSTIL
jgi:V/A-type H+-transporting ATPase subunit C